MVGFSDFTVWYNVGKVYYNESKICYIEGTASYSAQCAIEKAQCPLGKAKCASVCPIRLSGPNTNENIFRSKFFGENKYKYIEVIIFLPMTNIFKSHFFDKYKYKYIRAYQKWKNMNTIMIIRIDLK